MLETSITVMHLYLDSASNKNEHAAVHA